MYTAALYMRLSKEDGAGESSSIASQREILRRFTRENGIAVFDEYADDGYSGTNFNRPEFIRMKEDIEKGYINTVLVKDLSRLGRNSARTADLIDEYFPRKNVRFISVTDGYDSAQTAGGMMLAAPIMLAVHEIYARDTSNKIKSSFREKMRAGKYIGSFAPYGYIKDPQDKNHIIINSTVSHIVCEIFEEAVCKTPSEIAEKLNGKNIASPMQYRQTGSVNSYEPAWTASSVNKILRNPVYTGDMVQGKTAKISFKSAKTMENPKENWIIAKDTHEAIISRELFEKVQQVRRKRRGAV